MIEPEAVGRLQVAIASLLCLVVLSPVWVESDAYRYAAAIALAISYAVYARMAPPKPRTGWLGWACLAWALYVLLRLVADTVLHAQKVGSAEGIYLFIAASPALGFILLSHGERLRHVPDLFMLISLGMLAATIDLPAVLAGDRVPFLIHNNTIHASVGAGLIALLSIAYASHSLQQSGSAGRLRTALRLSLAGACLVLCMLGIFGAKSKGVWLALGIALPIQLLLVLAHMTLRSALLAAAAALLGAGLALHLAASSLLQEVGPHLASAWQLWDAAWTKGGWLALQDAIASGRVPQSLLERLMLWSNALEIWRGSFWFGAGSAWTLQWPNTLHAAVPYTLMHNGYMEILVRFGLTGMLACALLFAAMAALVIRAFRAGLLPAAAMQAWIATTLFFALTLLSNSNNRLAIGEAFMLAAAAVALHCELRLSGRKALPHAPSELRGSIA